MYRLWLLSLAVLLAPLALGVRDASAQTKTPVPRIEERRFVLYALEFLSIRLPAAANRPGGRFVSPHAILARYAAEQRLLFDILRRLVQKRKNEELPPLFDNYEKLLNVLDEWFKALDKPWLDYNKKLEVASSAASNRVLVSGLSIALAPAATDEEERRNFSRGLNAMFDAAIVEGQKLRLFNAAAGGELRSAFAATNKQFVPRCNEAHKRFQTPFEDFIEANKTEGDEFAFQLLKSKAEPERNPFWLTAKAGMILDNKDATVKELLEKAEVCRRAAAMVPVDRTFDIYRAVFLGIAGKIANRAAAKDIGTTGFPINPKSAPEAGKLAHKIWNDYAKVEPFDTNYTEEVVHAFILACAQAGYAPIAQTVILKTVVQPRRFGGALLNVNASARPEFWFDCARVSSVTGNTRLSLACLDRAVKVGYRDPEAAKIHPDLRNVRSDGGTSAAFNRLFP